jgi:hypothetical protein
MKEVSTSFTYIPVIQLEPTYGEGSCCRNIRNATFSPVGQTALLQWPVKCCAGIALEL